jgi:large subunit ribosomal protein L4
MEINLYSAGGEKKGHVDWAEYFKTNEPQGRTLHEVVTSYMANQRRGTSMTKTRGLVSGGGRKPWKQKGTGNARAGSIRSPLWRGGGTIFGPQPRSYRVILSDEKKRAALFAALSYQANQGAVHVLEGLADGSKTKAAATMLGKLKTTGSVMIVTDKISTDQRRAYANLHKVSLRSASDINALDVARSKTLVVTVPALQALSKRLAGE